MISLAKCKYRKFCRDDISKIENYHDAINSSEQYVLHHRLELTLDGEFAHTAEDLQRLDMYYNRPYFELIFLPCTVHSKMHADRRSHAYSSNLSKGRRGAVMPPNWHEHVASAARALAKARIGSKRSDTFKAKMRTVMNERRNSYQQYKSAGGTMTWNEFQRSVSK